MRVWPGSPRPLGASWDGEGTNFALFSAHASRVELCLFDTTEAAEARARVDLDRTGDVWHAYLPTVRPGQLYGYRVHGPWAPEIGHRFNPKKLLLDPYAKSVTGRIQWSDDLFGYRIGDPAADLVASAKDSAGSMPKSIVVSDAFVWGDDRAPRTPWSRTVLYECHVKGMTARHPAVPAELRGSYLGLASQAMLDHLSSLGVTAVELLPVQHFLVSRQLFDGGRTEYWGYNSIGFFAPDPRYGIRPGAQVHEFKSMVKAFHRAGIEVILDVVYNHTGEGNHLGPTVCFRGVDNASYYKLRPDDPRHYVDHTGCGNTLNVFHPRVLQMVLDSLRYWVTEMHVDGFRFDLASTLARDHDAFEADGRFFTTIQQDPVLSQVKLIAEPWDVGPGGYQVGSFPGGWAEWNDKYRDCARRFWRGDAGQVPELASRLSGSSDLFGGNGRGPWASVNFVTCHDGFTLRDLVSYERQHNEANGPDAGGTDANWSRNWGHEGETGSLPVERMRARTQRNLLATLALSQGVPMISHGDELGRSQRGNNNAYCHDSELSWLDWNLDEPRRQLLDFTREVFRLRRENPVFRRRGFFSGGSVPRGGGKDVTWVRADGREMTAEDWHDPQLRVLGMLVHGQASDELDERGRPNRGATLLLLVNGGSRARHFALPPLAGAGIWRERVNTARPPAHALRANAVNLAAHSLILLERGRPS